MISIRSNKGPGILDATLAVVIEYFGEVERYFDEGDR